MAEKTQTVVYDFEALNLSDYKCSTTFAARQAVFNKIYRQSIAKMRRHKKITMKTAPNEPPKEIAGFEIDARYYNVINVALKSIIKLIEQEINPDGIYILSHNVSAARMARDDIQDMWFINVDITGQYMQK
jgi:hypothetical protein